MFKSAAEKRKKMLKAKTEEGLMIPIKASHVETRFDVNTNSEGFT